MVDVGQQVGKALLQIVHALLGQLVLRAAAVMLQGAHGGHQHNRVGPQSALAALDVQELLRPQVAAEASLGDHIIGQAHGGFRGDDAYNLPNEALNAGEIDLNAFQHKAYLNNDAANNGYSVVAFADTLIAPLTLYSQKYDSLEAIKEAAGLK